MIDKQHVISQILMAFIDTNSSGHLSSYAEIKKMKSQELRGHGCARASLRDFSYSLLL